MRQRESLPPRLYVIPPPEGLRCQFLEEGLKTSQPREITLEDPVKHFEIAVRGSYRLNLEGRQAIAHGIETGRGGIWLELTEAQYAKLKKR
jgi:hypothetical protein